MIGYELSIGVDSEIEFSEFEWNGVFDLKSPAFLPQLVHYNLVRYSQGFTQP
jgi:hypothetical protein